jgi:hypothetical protein
MEIRTYANHDPANELEDLQKTIIALKDCGAPDAVVYDYESKVHNFRGAEDLIEQVKYTLAWLERIANRQSEDDVQQEFEDFLDMLDGRSRETVCSELKESYEDSTITFSDTADDETGLFGAEIIVVSDGYEMDATLEWDKSADRVQNVTFDNILEREDSEDTLEYLLENHLFNTRYTVSNRREYESVEIMTSCGGPNIYVDTGLKRVIGCWGASRVEAEISSEVCEMLDNCFEEMWGSID